MRRKNAQRRRRQDGLILESLEARRLLSSGASALPWHPTNNNPYDVENGPLANFGQTAIAIYKEYQTYVAGGSKGQFNPVEAKTIYFSGTNLEMDLHGLGDFPTYVSALKSMGMTVTATSQTNQIAEGYVPLANLVQFARQAQTIGGSPIYKPVTSYVGAGNNEAETALGAATARTTYGVNGAGVKIGVLSNSVSEVGTGLAGSVASGDLPPNVQVIQEGTPGGDDEGRAMLENIHDIVPGAALAFATADNGPVAFANNILALANAGAGYITDDVSYENEPMFQDGPIQQAINQVTSAGVVYTSSAANGADSGYLSTFRPVTATVTGVGTGTFMNFDPSGATQATKLGILVYNGATIQLAFDQAITANGGGITSQVNVYVLDASNNVVASGTSNNVATQSPFQNLPTIPNGSYSLVVQLVSGPAPGHIELNEVANMGWSVDHQYGSAGGTYYPDTRGHNGGASTIGVAATPWFNTPAYDPGVQLNNEPFSSFGPELSLFNPDGTPKAAQVVQNPVISAPDGGNTSFFGDIINTTQPPFPQFPGYTGQPPTTFGEVATATNLSQNLPSFFGTSAATENLLSSIVLIKQAVPTATTQQVLSALENTSTLLDGQARNVWNPQAGYGEANTVQAIQYLQTQASTLNVTFISPGGNQTVTKAPTAITVYFNKPINLSSVTASDLVVTGPNGATVTVGAPIGVDSPTYPTVIQFPITINPAPGTIANGIYLDRFMAGSITSQSGLALSGTISDQFNVQQVSAPQVTAASYVGRIINVVFSEPMNANTVTAQSLYLFRAGGVGTPLFTASSIVVSQLPGAVFSYNATNNTATINLTNVPQSELPSDHYALVALSSITDSVGNHLNGAFNGVFPSGVFPAVAAGTNFVQDLGIVNASAPIITSLTLATASDSGIQGDNNTNVTTPSFTGQLTTTIFGTVAGLVVYAEFTGINHAGVPRGGLNLAVGGSGRGFVGTYDVQTTTNALGQFTITYPAGVTPLPEGENRIRVVVVAQVDTPPFPGFSTSQDYAFRIDNTGAYVGTTNGSAPTSVAQNANINSLTSLSLSIVDPVNPQTLGDPFAVDPRLAIPALNPSSVSNTSSYKLFLVNSGGQLVDESSFIKTATFVSTSARVLSSDPFTGVINLTFGAGLPNGSYEFVALSSGFGDHSVGLSDAAGNAFAAYQGASQIGVPANYQLNFNLQPTPVYITGYAAYSADPSSGINSVITGPRADYEIPIAGATPRAAAPPTQFTLDFSNSLNPYVDYTNAVQLLRSADTITSGTGTTSLGQVDGNFGNLGNGNTTGYTRVAGVTVALENSVQGATYGQYGYLNRLLISLPAGSTLPADYYRLYLPNTGTTSIADIFGNQLDGEFQGYQNAQGVFVDQLQNGQVRGTSAVQDLSGDGTAGGAFMTGFVVVPNGNIIYARPDALYNPQVPGQIPNGSAARPYPVLAPEAVPNAINGGDLNSVVNSGANFNTNYDRAGLGTFQPSAFFAAQQLTQETGGPVVILAEASIPTRDPVTGLTVQRPFVLQAPAGSDPIINDASAAVPAMTTLVFEPGTALKMQNAALLVQNQGSALQVEGGPNSYQTVTITSYKDSSVGGATNGDPNSLPQAGDYGGIVFRNFSQAALPTGGAARNSLFPGQIPVTNSPLLDNRLKGQFTNTNDPASQVDAVSGADDIMSFVNFLVEKYAGGAVPQTNGTRYDGITLQNSRPTIVNSEIAYAGGAGSAQAGLSVNVDSLRQDDVAAGPLLRNDVFLNNGLNGIYIRAEYNGIAEPTNAMAYTTNATTQGGAANYVLNDPYPYLLTSRMVVGQQVQVETGGSQLAGGTSDRLYIIPGMVVKFEQGAGLQVTSRSASLNVGDQTYIHEYDANHNNGPTLPALLPNGQANPQAGQPNPNFVANSSALAKVIFTSLNDDKATTSYFDPLTQITTTIVQALAAVPGGSGVLQPIAGGVVPDQARWGGVSITSGAVAVINSAIFRFGGGALNTATGTQSIHVLEIGGGQAGAHISITNNQFDDNSDVPVNLQPNSLLAGDPQRPLLSGDPFIHGNTMFNNGVNAVGVQGGTNGVINVPNLTVNSVWTGGDFTYALRDTIVLAGGFPITPANITTQLVTEPSPIISLTLQSTLPGTVLADGTTVASPGVPLIIKVLNDPNGTGKPTPFASIGTTIPAANIPQSYQGGAGFIVGVDNGIDPTADSLIDPGAFSQIRILGIGANQSTGQPRVPVIITSLNDNTVGTTVNNVVMDQALPTITAPAAGDGGVIYFGGNSLTSFDLQDPRSGSIIDNADIKYITRVEQQGGGILYAYGPGANTALSPTTGDVYGNKLGLPLNGINGTNFGDQYNQAKQLTISNSNLSTFSDDGFIAHPGYAQLEIAQNFNFGNGVIVGRAGFDGEATHTYLVNDTFSTMPNAAVIISQPDSADTNDPSPAEAIFLNDTFYNNGVAIHTIGAVPALPFNPLAHTSTLIMDSIFATGNTSLGTGAAILEDGLNFGSEIQYNLFYGITGVTSTTNVSGGNNPVPLNQSIFGDPAFRNAPAGNFNLLPSSAAIDRARSEIGPDLFGDMLEPAATIDPTNLNMLPIRNTTGDQNPFGGFVPILNFGGPQQPDIVTLPGEPVSQRGFPDLWVPTLNVAAAGTTVSGLTTSTTTPGTIGTSASAATYAYVPIAGERDQQGNLRIKDPNSPNVGFGSRPFFDLGAFEYIIQNPPVVEQFFGTTSTGNVGLYKPGGVAGLNQVPTSIQLKFNSQLDPTTITANSVILLASGGDGIFGNGNSPNDRAISLAGKLSFNATTDILTINTTGLFATGAALNDEYQLILKGTGSSVIKDRNGLALDGYTANDTLPLPSGSDQFPGSDFLVNFTIDTNSPSLVAGTFKLSPASDTSGGLGITKNTTPTFIGTITDVFPPANPLLGDTVYVDISTKGDLNFDDIAAAVGTTDANGNFTATVTTPLPNTPYFVGPSGIQGVGDGYRAIARVRIVNQAGNASATLTTPLSTFIATGAVTQFEVDTTPPKVTAITPSTSALATPTSNQVLVTATFSKNINPATLNANTIQVFRAGGTGVFTGNGIQVPIVAGSIAITYLKTAAGAIQVQFAIAGPLPNDLYRIVLKGTGTAPITDLAGNALDGAGTGTSGSDFVDGPFTVFAPTNSKLIYVSNSPAQITVPTATQGTRENPFTTIAAGLTAANTGDVVLVLPGTYKENVTLKAQVRLLSADLSSTDTTAVPGSPLQTLIYGATTTTGGVTSTGTVVVTATGLTSVTGVPTEISGFSIIDPLIGNSVTGTIDTTSVAVSIKNSNVLVDKNYIINAGIGVNVTTSGASAATPTIETNVIAGNIYGIQLSDTGATSSLVSPINVINNTIADNTYGLANIDSTANVTQAEVLNNIFYSNHDLTKARNGTGIQSPTAFTLVVGTNLFYQNGASAAGSSQATGSFLNFVPANLSATPDAYGNLLGNPAFVAARDPRPNGDTPPVFFLSGNYDLTLASPAVNAALQAVAPATDILYRKPVAVPGKGFNGSGPASIGAFYYAGTGGIVPITGVPAGGAVTPVSGTPTTGGTVVSALALSNPIIGGSLPIGTKQFNVVTTSLSPDGTSYAAGANGGTAYEPAPSSITVNFSDNINPSSIVPGDLVLAGDGLSTTNPARATSLTWIDGHTIRFNLTGGFNASGKVQVAFTQGSLVDTLGATLVGFADNFQIGTAPAGSTTGQSTTVPSPVTPVAGVPGFATVVQPLAVAGPVAIHYAKATPKGAKAHHVATKSAAHSLTVKPAHSAAPKAAGHSSKSAKPAAKTAHKAVKVIHKTPKAK